MEAILTNTAKGETVAVHVGFWRPSTPAVAEVAQQWSSSVLLSDSACATFEPPLSLSRHSIATVEDVSFRLALSGFGYDCEDPTSKPSPAPNQAESKPIAELLSAQQKRGWVQWLESTSPDLAKEAFEHGIWDEDSYLEQEAVLPKPLRLRLGIARYKQRAGGDPHPTSLLDNLRFCPPWILALPLHRLGLTVRMRNVFRNHSLHTVGDVAALGLNKLQKLPNLGHGSVAAFAKLVYEAFVHASSGLKPLLEPPIDPDQEIVDDFNPTSDSDPQQDSALQAVALDTLASLEFPSFIDGIAHAARVLKDNERGIWAARLGYKCKPLTLQAIATNIGLTRERVRQIEVKVYRRVANHPVWIELERRLSSLLDGRTEPLLVHGLSALDPWFDGAETLVNPLREICDHLLGSRFHVFMLDDTPVISRVSLADWEQAVREARSHLRATVAPPIPESQARLAVDSFLIGAGEELRGALWEHVIKDALWSSPAGHERQLVGFARSAEGAVLAVLHASDRPLHFTEIHQRASDLGYTDVIPLRIHGAAANVAILYGRGTFGLEKHCPLSTEELDLIRSEVDELLSNGDPRKQWHTNELYEELLADGVDFDGRLTKYIINYALKKSPGLAYLGRMIWGREQNWTRKTASRLDIRQAVLSLVESAGRPLSTDEIRERMRTDRGVNEFFQIFPHGNLVRVGPRRWGLYPRDIDREKYDALAAKLAQALEASAKGLHLSEIPMAIGMPSTADDDEIRTIVSLSNRMGVKLDRGQYAYLEKWGVSHRMSVTDAMHAVVMDMAGRGASLEAIHKRVCQLTRRTLTKSTISSALQSTDLEWSPATGLWSAKSNKSEEPEDETSEPSS